MGVGGVAGDWPWVVELEADMGVAKAEVAESDASVAGMGGVITGLIGLEPGGGGVREGLIPAASLSSSSAVTRLGEYLPIR